MDQLRKGTGHTKKTYCELEEEIEMLKNTILTNENEFEEMYNNLSAENINLKVQIGNLLRCDECEERFNNKTELKHHTQSKHSVHEFKCAMCDKCFADSTNMKMHMEKDHIDEKHQVTRFKGMKCNSGNKMFQLKSVMEQPKIKGHITLSKEDLLKRHTELLKKVTLQKVSIVNSLFKLKQIEDKQKQICSCRGFCRILHSRFRWKPSQSDNLFEKFEAINKSFLRVQCKICDIQFTDEEILKNHVKTNHQSSTKNECKQCDETFNEENELKIHFESVHALENYKCQECEHTCRSENRLKVPDEKEHEIYPLNSTFFNPSASQ